MLERNFQAKTIKEIKKMFPGCFVLKCDGSDTPQGFPDFLILYKNKWAALEFKRSEEARYKELQPNQEYYVDTVNKISFASFIYPENKEDVLNELQQTFGT